MRPCRTLSLALAIAVAMPALAADRSRQARAEFMRSNPCPATGRTSGPCPGWQVDHIRSLCAGGADTPGNMQWLRTEDHKRKTPSDVGHCRAVRAGVAS